jgi:NAD(P)-dependent dehydrogenase (short-subunit alcohol dehydrogenase family)
VSEFDGRSVLVTGAAGNIGRATALLLAQRGARVIVADLGAAEASLNETCDGCGDGAIAVTFDVTDRVAAANVIAGVSERVGGLDGLVNNAGYQGAFANLLDYPGDDFDRVQAINVGGVFNVLQACARVMADGDRGGSIVNLASMAGVTGAPNMAAYTAAKAAVIGLTKSAARDLAEHNIRVNAVSPAFIGPGAMWDRQVQLQADTPSIYFSDDPAEVAEQMIGSVPLRRYGSLEEVAEVIAFLLSSRSSYVTATNTEITGGSA